MGALSPTHWLIIIGVLVVLFGAKRLPDAARGIGRSARILRAEVRDVHGDIEDGLKADVPSPTDRPAAALPSPTTSG